MQNKSVCEKKEPPKKRKENMNHLLYEKKNLNYQ